MLQYLQYFKAMSGMSTLYKMQMSINKRKVYQQAFISWWGGIVPFSSAVIDCVTPDRFLEVMSTLYELEQQPWNWDLWELKVCLYVCCLPWHSAIFQWLTTACYLSTLDKTIMLLILTTIHFFAFDDRHTSLRICSNPASQLCGSESKFSLRFQDFLDYN